MEPDWRDSNLPPPTPSDLEQVTSRFQFPHLCVCTCVCACARAHMHIYAQLCPTLFKPMDCCPPGSSVHGIFLAKIQEWITMSSSMGTLQTQGLNPCLLHCMQIHHTAPPPQSPFLICRMQIIASNTEACSKG